MMDDARLETLKARHAELDRQILDEVKRPNPDQNLVHQLKREKLNVKDEIQRVTIH